MKPRSVFLHICCAPCLIYPAGCMEAEGIDFEGYFFNPNIHPMQEFRKRYDTLVEFSIRQGYKVKYDETYMQDEWIVFKGTDMERCVMCYSIRLDKTAELAKLNGYSAFSTTLLVSPYQKHDLIKHLGEKASEENDISFYYRDFRDGYRTGRQLARDYGLYRQKYCGCIYSK